MITVTNAYGSGDYPWGPAIYEHLKVVMIVWRTHTARSSVVVVENPSVAVKLNIDDGQFCGGAKRQKRNPYVGKKFAKPMPMRSKKAMKEKRNVIGSFTAATSPVHALMEMLVRNMEH